MILNTKFFLILLVIPIISCSRIKFDLKDGIKIEDSIEEKKRKKCKDAFQYGEIPRTFRDFRKKESYLQVGDHEQEYSYKKGIKKLYDNKACPQAKVLINKFETLKAIWSTNIQKKNKKRNSILAEHKAFKKKYPNIVRLKRDFPRSLIDYYTLNQITDGYAIFVYTGGNSISKQPIIGIKRSTIKALNKHSTLYQVADCLKFTKTTTTKNLRGFDITIKLHNAVSCPK